MVLTACILLDCNLRFQNMLFPTMAFACMVDGDHASQLNNGGLGPISMVCPIELRSGKTLHRQGSQCFRLDICSSWAAFSKNFANPVGKSLLLPNFPSATPSACFWMIYPHLSLIYSKWSPLYHTAITPDSSLLLSTWQFRFLFLNAFIQVACEDGE